MAKERRLIDAWKLVIDLAKLKMCGEYDHEDVMAVIASQKTVDAVGVDEYNAIVSKLEKLLCHATGGKFSKAGYAWKDMERMVTDYIEECCEDAVAEEVVHGRWIHPKGYVVSNGFLCSECGHEEGSLFPINPRPGGVCIADENGNFYHPPKMNYCPNCGAKMDGDGNA